MGNSRSAAKGARAQASRDDAEDVKRQVDGDESNQKTIYQLVNVKSGGGKLIDIIKAASRGPSLLGSTSTAACNGDASGGPLDAQIRQLVQPLLYNEGRGKLVPLSELWRLRLTRERPGVGGPAEDVGGSPPGSHCWACWRLDERGFVGESALHICFLLSTSSHMILARKLLQLYPMLINDLYTCDEYFGEACLHMAIVSENVRIVKLLLDHGADVHARCLGSFFLPADQKDTANGAVRARLAQPSGPLQAGAAHFDWQQNHLAKLDTDYDGTHKAPTKQPTIDQARSSYAYWGEFPLSFAVCLGLADCFTLLMAKGADPDRQDSNGNTSLHMAVVANRKDMFDLCYASGASLSIVNRRNLSPLLLAATLGRTQILFHILKIQQQVSWMFCDIGFIDMPLEDIDSLDTKTGSCNELSVLALLVYESDNRYLDMLSPAGPIGQLLELKWSSGVRSWYRWRSLQFLLFMTLAAFVYVLRLDPDRARPAVVLGAELSFLISILFYLWTAHKTGLSLGGRSFLKTAALVPEFSVFLLSCILVLACVPLRLAGFKQAEHALAALAMLTLPLKMLFFCRASRSLGSFLIMIYRILVNDVVCFVLFAAIFVAGFSQSFTIIFNSWRPPAPSANSSSSNNINNLANQTNFDNLESRNYFDNLFDGVLAMHIMALNEFSMVYDEFDNTQYPVSARLLFLTYMVLASILLFNMLIAMLGKTFQDIAGQPNENLRQWARALLTIERIESPAARRRLLDKYSHVRDGKHYLSTVRTLSAAERDEIRDIEQLNAEHCRNAAKLLSRRPGPT